MKKTSSIFLLTTLLVTLFCNVLGYRMLFAFDQEQEWITAMQKIPDSDFKIIQLNATLYSFREDTDFEYINENITINHKLYHIFKKRIKDNVLNLYYLPNTKSSLSSKKIENIVDNQLFNSSKENKNGSKKITKTFSIDFIIENQEKAAQPIIANHKLKPIKSFSDIGLNIGHTNLLYSPPDLV
jgi:hypothetical protein